MKRKHAQQIEEMIKNITVIVLVIIMLCWCSWYETHYTKKATVIDITNNIVTVVDSNDYTWSFEGSGFDINDEVKLTINTMHTDSNILDDEIENVKIINK